ncbi:MAG: transposase, partial [Verrucomicrobiales bacterium]
MTHPQSSDSQILKIDSRQRVRVGRQRREALLDEFERSGLSGPAFSKRHGIKYSTFASWSLKRRKQERPADGLPTLAERRIHSPSAQMKQAEARMCVKASFNFETKQCQAPTDASAKKT